MSKNKDMCEGYVVHGYTRDSEGNINAFCLPNIIRDRNTAMGVLRETLENEAYDLYDMTEMSASYDTYDNWGDLWVENDLFYMMLEVVELNYCD